MFNVEAVKRRLASFGYKVGVDDMFALTFCLEKVGNAVKNTINCTDIPEGLEHIAVDRACGEFLYSKLTFAPNDLENIDLDFAVKQISTGDTSTTFATESGSSPEQRLKSFIELLLNTGMNEFNRYRRVLW